MFLISRELKEFLERRPIIETEDEANRLFEAVQEDDTAISAEEAAIEYDEMHRLKFGTTTHCYISFDYMQRYNQFEINTFYQFILESRAREV